jgi:hypothetical protein
MGALPQIFAVGESSAGGAALLTFPTVPATQQYQGSVVVPTAPAQASITVTDDGNPIGVIAGSNTYGPFSLLPGHVLALVCTGMAASTQYTATFTGSTEPPGSPIVTPTSNSSVTQISGPVTAEITGPVTVNGNVTALNPQSQIAALEALVLTVVEGIQEGSITVNVPAGCLSLAVYAQVDGANASTENTPLAVSALQEGASYPSDVSLLRPLQSYPVNTAVIDVLSGTNDVTLQFTTFNLTAPSEYLVYVWAYPFPAAMVRQDRDEETFWGAFTGYVESAGAGNNATLLPAPDNAGMVWDIRHLEAHAEAGATTSGDYLQIVGLTSGAYIANQGQLTPATTLWTPTRVQIAEGLQLQNRLAAATAYASAWARQIPAAP